MKTQEELFSYDDIHEKIHNTTCEEFHAWLNEKAADLIRAERKKVTDFFDGCMLIENKKLEEQLKLAHQLIKNIKHENINEFGYAADLGIARLIDDFYNENTRRI